MRTSILAALIAGAFVANAFAAEGAAPAAKTLEAAKPVATQAVEKSVAPAAAGSKTETLSTLKGEAAQQTGAVQAATDAKAEPAAMAAATEKTASASTHADKAAATAGSTAKHGKHKHHHDKPAQKPAA